MISRELEKDSLPLYYPWEFWILLSWQTDLFFLPCKRNTCVIWYKVSHEDKVGPSKAKGILQGLNWSEGHGMMRLNHYTWTRILLHQTYDSSSLSFVFFFPFSFPGLVTSLPTYYGYCKMRPLALWSKNQQWILTINKTQSSSRPSRPYGDS